MGRPPGDRHPRLRSPPIRPGAVRPDNSHPLTAGPPSKRTLTEKPPHAAAFRSGRRDLNSGPPVPPEDFAGNRMVEPKPAWLSRKGARRPLALVCLFWGVLGRICTRCVPAGLSPAEVAHGSARATFPFLRTGTSRGASPGGGSLPLGASAQQASDRWNPRSVRAPVKPGADEPDVDERPIVPTCAQPVTSW